MCVNIQALWPSTLCLQSKKEKKEEKDLPPVKEEDVSGSKKDPSNSSGCVVS